MYNTVDSETAGVAHGAEVGQVWYTLFLWGKSL